MTKTLFLILSLSTVFSPLFSRPIFAQSDLPSEMSGPPTMEMLASVHERLLYEVKYGFIKLGKVEVLITPDTTWKGQPAIHLRTIMYSNSRIPFVGRKEVHYQSFSGYTDEWPYSYLFWRDDLHDEEYNRNRIVFDRDRGEVRFFEYDEPSAVVELEDPASGGDVIFLFARMFAGTYESYTMPVYIDDDQGSVTATNSPATDERRYDAFQEPVETYYSEGVADISGPFGFTGKFKAWFATNDLRTPLEAHVRIAFGNVRLRLIEYERYE